MCIRDSPDGTDLKWKQVGVKELLTDPELPFFIQWEDGHHPSEVGSPSSAIQEIVFANTDPLSRTSFKDDVIDALASTGINISVTKAEEETGLSAVTFETKSGLVQIF